MYKLFAYLCSAAFIAAIVLGVKVFKKKKRGLTAYFAAAVAACFVFAGIASQFEKPAAADAGADSTPTLAASGALEEQIAEEEPPEAAVEPDDEPDAQPGGETDGETVDEPAVPAPEQTQPARTPAAETEPAAEPAPAAPTDAVPAADPTPGPDPEPEPTVEPEPEPAPVAEPAAPAPQPDPSAASTAEGNYVASRDSDKYHYLGCRFAKEILPENRIYFDTVEDAQAANYSPCGSCHPH